MSDQPTPAPTEQPTPAPTPIERPDASLRELPTPAPIEQPTPAPSERPGTSSTAASRHREPLVVLTRTTLPMRLMATGFRFLFRAVAHVRTSGLEGLPQSGPLIVVANHTTLADPPFVAAWLQPALGRPIQFLAKEQLFTPLMRPILRMYGAIFVRAGGSDVEAYRAALTVLRGGAVVSVFPEGTRSLDGIMREPRAGVALIAARSGVPIVPVGISGGQRLLPSGRTLPAFGTRLTLRVGRPFRITLDPSLDRRAATEAAADEIMRRIAALVDADQRGRFGDRGDAP